MAMMINIPIGFRFIPTDEELIGGFLWPRLMGFELPWNGIVEKEVYGDNTEPWKVFGDVDGWQTKKEGGAIKSTIYAFTTLKNVPNSKRISRRAGSGTWSGQTGPKKIRSSDTGEIIGHSKMFSFERVDGAPAADLGHWIMHEYSLRDSANGGDLVVCKITKCFKVSAAATASKKRAAVESHLEQEVGAGCKKQKISCCGGGAGFPYAAVPQPSDFGLFPGIVEYGGNGEGFPAAEDESWQPLDFDDDIDVESLFAGVEVEFVSNK